MHVSLRHQSNFQTKLFIAWALSSLSFSNNFESSIQFPSLCTAATQEGKNHQPSYSSIGKKVLLVRGRKTSQRIVIQSFVENVTRIF